MATKSLRYIDMVIDGKFKGLYSCDCHLFETYEELREANLQRFKPGQTVKHRCNKHYKGTGVITSVEDVWIQINDFKSGLNGQHHVENLILVEPNPKKDVTPPTAPIDEVEAAFEKRYKPSMDAILAAQKPAISLGYRKNHNLKKKTQRQINKLLALPPVERNHLLNAICQQFALTPIQQTTLNL